MKLKLLALLCATLPTMAAAQSFKAINRLDVFPLSNGAFEVIEARGEGARGIWCAAADYALARSRASGQRLYISGARGPAISRPGRKGVVFTTDVDALGVSPQKSLSVSVRTRGLSLPVHHAYQFCRDYQIDIEDIFLRKR